MAFIKVKPACSFAVNRQLKCRKMRAGDAGCAASWGGEGGSRTDGKVQSEILDFRSGFVSGFDASQYLLSLPEAVTFS